MSNHTGNGSARVKTITFKCPSCGRKFGKRLDYVPGGCNLIQECPFCHQTIELTPDDVVDEPTAKVFAVDIEKTNQLLKEK